MFVDKLIAAVHELGRGEVSPSTRDFLCGLKRPLPPSDPPLKLFALNYDVDKHNSDK